MKKTLTFILILVFTLISTGLIGCGSKDNDTPDTDEATETVEDAADQKPKDHPAH